MNNLEQTPVRRNPWHSYPPGWREDHWLVPFTGDNAVIHHGHSNPEDHSQCGPLLFCCAKSQEAFLANFPTSLPANITWELTTTAHISAWLEAGVSTLYFMFCDPVRPDGLLSGGLTGEQARQALFKEIALEQFAESATRLR